MNHDGPRRRLSVALFTDSAAPVRNGVSVSVDALVRRLREVGHSAHVFTARYPGYADEDPNYHRVRSVMTGFAGGYPMALPPFPPEKELFFREGFDVIHIHTPFVVGITGLAWARQAGIPVVATYHTQYDRYLHYVPWAPDGLKRCLAINHIRGMLNKADQVIVPSVVTRRWLSKLGVRTPTTVIPTGIPRPRRLAQFSERERLGARPGHTIVLTCGRLASEKNQGLLVSAFGRAAMADPSLQLWVVGDGPGRKEITEMVRRAGIGDRVRFFGSVPRKEVDRFYAASDIFAFTSVTETQGLVVLEAMSYGLPVVVCRGGAACSPIRHGQNGLKVGTSPEAVAGAILSLAHDEALAARLSDAARETAKSATVEVMADMTVKVYEAAIGGSAASQRKDHARTR